MGGPKCQKSVNVVFERPLIRYGFTVAYGFMYTKMLTARLILSKLGFYAHAKPVI